MTRVRKKLSKSGWIILALVAVGLIAAPILHFTGVSKLDWIGDWGIMGAQWAALSGWNTLIVGLAIGGFGFALCYILKDYVIGIEDTNNNLQVTTSPGYNPAPTQPTTSGVAVS